MTARPPRTWIVKLSHGSEYPCSCILASPCGDRSPAPGRRGPVPGRRAAIEHVNYYHVKPPDPTTRSPVADSNF
ncbi:hypothetical protein BN903_30 [Halorubrum sp. AJ67]|nr:hypothetical protein BN903_30 [Halorubrum sp. AJ67]